MPCIKVPPPLVQEERKVVPVPQNQVADVIVEVTHVEVQEQLTRQVPRVNMQIAPKQI